MEEVNGLSPFSVDMDIPGEIIKPMQDFFCPQNRYMRYNTRNDNATNQIYNGGDEEYFDATLTIDIIPVFV